MESTRENVLKMMLKVLCKIWGGEAMTKMVIDRVYSQFLGIHKTKENISLWFDLGWQWQDV